LSPRGKKARAKKKTTRKLRQPAKPAPKGRRKSKGAGPSAVERLFATGGVVTEDLRIVRFAGVALGGGKTDKTAVATIEYYPERKRVFLRSLRERIGASEDETADDRLLHILNEEERGLKMVAFDAPLQFPACIRYQFEKPGDKEREKEAIDWMQEMHRKRDKLKRPNKMFTPYTERCAEIYIAHELEEQFHPSHALGANAAPLAARANFLLRKLARVPVIEVYPKLSLWRIGMSLGVPKSHLRFHKHAVDSDEARHFVLKTLIEKEIAFIYQQDMKTMVQDNIAFEAFISALTAYLKFRGQVAKPPRDFPGSEIWIEFPVEHIRWF
jgi:predicted nuclease with RNAse H fold